MYSNKTITNDVPMKKLVPFFNNERRKSYTDGMGFKNESRNPLVQSSGVPLTSQIEKLQKKLIDALETNYEVNKKYGNILSNANSNESTSNSKPVPSTSEQKRSAAINLLRKRTNNIINIGDNSINSYRKGSIDENLLIHHNSNSSNNNSIDDKTTQRQQALSVLMRRVSNANVNNNNNNNNSVNNNEKLIKKNDSGHHTTINTNLGRYSFDNVQNSSVYKNYHNNRLDTVQSPNVAIKTHESINSPYYNSLSNYDMVSSPISGMPNIFKGPMDMITNSSSSLNALNNYDMTTSNNMSSSLSPISPTNSFINNSRRSVNLGSVGMPHKLFENNRLLTNDSTLYDINSCPTSPIGNFSSGSFFTGGSNGSFPSTEELSQKIAENQIMIEYLSKLCINSEVTDKDTSIFANNIFNNSSKLPPAPTFLNNELNNTNFNDYNMQSVIFPSSSSPPHSSPSQNFNEVTSPFVSRSGNQTYSNNNNNNNNNNNKFTLSESPANPTSIMNNLPSPYVNKIINSNLGMPTSPYLGNAKTTMTTTYSGSNNNNNGNNNGNSNGNVNGLTSPQFNITPSSSPYININMDTNQTFQRNSSYVNLIGRGIPSPSPSFSNGSSNAIVNGGSSNNNSNNNSRFMINNTSPGLYPVRTTMGMNELSQASFLNDNISVDIQQQNKFNSKSIHTSPNVGYSEPNLFNNNSSTKVIPSVMDQRIFYDNKLNSMIPSMYNNNNNNPIQISQSMLPAYTSTTNVLNKQIPSPSIGAIGSLRHNINKSVDKENSKKMNPLASLASEKRKSSPLINSESIEDDFSQLSLGDNSLPTNINFTKKTTSTLLSGSSPLNKFNITTSELSAMEPKPKLSSSTLSDTSNPSFSSLSSKAVGSNLKNANSNNQLQLNNNSTETTYKLFDKSVYDLPNSSELPALNNFESSLNAVIQNQSLEDSPIINTIEDKNFNSYNSIDIQMTSDALSNNSNNSNNIFSLSMQHPVLT